MKILIIGASGTLGKKLAQHFSGKHEVITAGRSSGDFRVDITSRATIEQLFREVKSIDACVCVAASGSMDNFGTLTEEVLLHNMKGKLFGQVNLVLIGRHYLNNGGSFTLTSGIFADEPAKGVTGGGMISGALHSFVLSAALELQGHQRINVVSPGMLEDSAAEYGALFPALVPVSMDKITDAYIRCIETSINGQIIRVYDNQ